MSSKRKQGFGKAEVKMTAEQYQELIGRHKHIEHKGLRQEVTKEFAAIVQKRKLPTEVVSCNNIVNPPQPPPLPLEANAARNQQFRKSVPWPKYSEIQRIVYLFHYGGFDRALTEKFLRASNVAAAKIQIALQVVELIEHSGSYWRKHEAFRKQYTSRYNTVTRKYALQNAPWTLQIAMTLKDFHLDHIVDIVYQKPLWSADYDRECQRKRQAKPPDFDADYIGFNEDEEEEEEEEQNDGEPAEDKAREIADAESQDSEQSDSPQNPNDGNDDGFEVFQ